MTERFSQVFVETAKTPRYVKKMKPKNADIEKIADMTELSCFEKKRGGPFGAFVFDDGGNVVAFGCNSVIADNDPTAHAEIVAIRAACKKLGTYDLSGYSLYATGFPCPMCLSAIIWARLKKVYYGAPCADAEKIGFRDDFIYDFINGGLSDTSVLELENIPSERLGEIYGRYAKSGKIY